MILNEIDLFKETNFEVMEEMAAIASEKSYDQGTVLFARGEPAGCLYVLVRGAIDLVIESGGSTIVYNLTEPGEIFGWSSLVDPGVYTASAVCARETKVVELPKKKLDKLFDLHPEVGLKVLRRLGRVFARRLSNVYQDLLSARGQHNQPSYG